MSESVRRSWYPTHLLSLVLDVMLPWTDTEYCVVCGKGVHHIAAYVVIGSLLEQVQGDGALQQYQSLSGRALKALLQNDLSS